MYDLAQGAGPMETSQIRRWLVIAALALAAGCSTVGDSPKLGHLYTRTAQAHDPNRNPVILIPGILGSRLKAEGTKTLVWGSFSGDYADPGTAKGARLVALPMTRRVPLGGLRDKVYPDGVVDQLEASFLGISIEVDAYRHILGTLGAGGYRDEDGPSDNTVKFGDDHFTCFQFAYDWRRDIAESARQLRDFILEKEALVKRERKKRFGSEGGPVKFDIVAHSMGGLVARYFLRYGAAELPRTNPEPTWAGARHVERLIMVGTPNAGSLDALTKLIEGEDFSIITPEYDAAVLGTFPSLYQLLPRTRHLPVHTNTGGRYTPIDLYDMNNWRQFRWGLLDPDRDDVLTELLPKATTRNERLAIADDHLQKCLARALLLHAALDVPATPPQGVALLLFSGDAVATPSAVFVDRKTGELETSDNKAGDGTVLRSSALMDERIGSTWTARLESPIRWHQVIFLFTDHLGMTMDPHFSDNLLFQLLEAQR